MKRIGSKRMAAWKGVLHSRSIGVSVHSSHRSIHFLRVAAVPPVGWLRASGRTGSQVGRLARPFSRARAGRPGMPRRRPLSSLSQHRGPWCLRGELRSAGRRAQTTPASPGPLQRLKRHARSAGREAWYVCHHPRSRVFRVDTSHANEGEIERCHYVPAA
jgi:hypothetical protein